MKPEIARFFSSMVIVACVTTAVLIGTAGCTDAKPYIALSCLAAMAAFVALTQDI